MRSCFLSFVILLAAKAALACSCGIPESPCKAFQGIDVVFVGKVEKEDFREGTAYFTFSVREVLKGTPPSVVEVWTTKGGASCGFDFQVGETYLVFAYEHEDGELGTNSCTKTQHIRDAIALLPQLRSFSADASVASIFGTARTYSRTISEGDRQIAPLTGYRITLVSSKDFVSTVTDADGAFAFKHLQTGNYGLSLELPDTWTLAWPQPREVHGGENRCQELFLRVYPNGQIAGRILQFDGKPARGYARLVPADFQPRPSDKWNFGLLTDLDAEGAFWFGRLSPGKYKLFHIDKGPYEPNLTVTFFPGAAGLSDADVIELREPRRLEGIVFRLPERSAQAAAP